MFAALERQRSGDLPQAESLYRQVLAECPGLPDAMHMLGTTLYLRGRYIEATSLFDSLIESDISFSEEIAHNFGLVLGVRLAGREPEEHRGSNRAYLKWRASPASASAGINPTVSVVVPSYNHVAFIQSALESVFEQTYRSIEIIVIDDGSTDGSPAVIERTLRRSPFPSRFIARENRGAYATLNEAIALSVGDYINPLNSDDRFRPDRIARMVQEVAERGRDWGFSQISVIDNSGDASEWVACPLARGLVEVNAPLQTAEPAASLLFSANIAISTGNLFFTKRLFDRLGGFRDYRYNHDWDFALRAAALCEPARVNKSLYEYRIHGGNTITEAPARARDEAKRLISGLYREMLNAQPENTLTSRTIPNSTFFVSRFLLQGKGTAFSREELRKISKHVSDYDIAMKNPTLQRPQSQATELGATRIIAVTGVLDVVNALVALRASSEPLQPLRNHLVILGSAATSSVEARDVASGLISKIANELYCFSETTIIDDETSRRWQDTANTLGSDLVSNELTEYFGHCTVNELWLQHANGFLNRSLIGAFPTALRSCFGDGIGYYFPEHYHKSYASSNGAAGADALSGPKKHAATSEPHFHRIFEFIPNIYGENGSAVPIANRRESVLSELQSVATIARAHLPLNLSERIADRAVVLLLPTMAAEQRRLSLQNEVSAYLDYLSSLELSQGALLLLKPHPRSLPQKTIALASALSKQFSTVVALDSPILRLLPVEAIIATLKERVSTDQFERMNIVCFSTTSLSIPALFGLRTHFGFGESVVKRYFAPDQASKRIKHEAQLRLAAAQIGTATLIRTHH